MTQTRFNFTVKLNDGVSCITLPDRGRDHPVGQPVVNKKNIGQLSPTQMLKDPLIEICGLFHRGEYQPRASGLLLHLTDPIILMEHGAPPILRPRRGESINRKITRTKFLPIQMKSTITSHFKFLLLLSSSLLPFCVQAEEFTPDRVAVYKQLGETELRLHIFNPPEHSQSHARPVIVFFFGGGWSQGGPEQFFPHCNHFASRGMVAISAEYRINTTHGTSPREAVKDAKSAIRWIRRHAADLGMDPDRLAAGGGSAGGHLAAASATLEKFNEEGEDQSVSCIPDALVLFNPVIDNGPDGYGHDRVKEYWREFSPLHNLHKKTPPTIFFLGTNDRLIPTATAERYQALMVEKGLQCEVYFYEGQEHGFFNYRNTAYFRKTVKEADRFLTTLGFLEPES